MKDQNKTKKQLINELAELRQRVDELEALEKERKETAKALRESEGQFGLVADSLPVLISYVDWQQCYRFNNKAYERWFGHRREEVYGNHIKEVLGEPAYEVIRQYVETALSGQEVSFESWVSYKDGGNRYIRAIYIPHFGEKGEVKGFFALVDDLTEHKRKDEEVEIYEQSLEKLVEERTAKLILTIKELQQEIDERKQAEENLQRERDLLKHIAETSPAGIIVVNREGKITFANGRAEAVLGLTKDKITQRTYNDPEWRITALDGNPLPDEELPFQRVMKTGLPVYDKCHAIEWPNGRRVLLSVNAAPLFDGHGRADGMVATVEDITERIRMEEELRESEEKYKKLVEESLQGLIIGQGLPPRIIFANSTTNEILSYSTDELVSFSPEEVKELIHREDRTIFFQQYQERLEGKEVPSRRELRGIRKDGTVRWVELLARRIDYQGKPAVLATFVDITERKLAEDALRESEARYRALIESQIDLISRYRADGTLTFVNNAYCQFYGKTREELIGHSFLSMVAPEFHEVVLKETENMVKDPRPIVGEYLNYKQNGEECWIQWVIQGIVDENGRVVELQGVGRDITRLKQTEQFLRQSEENYRDLYENAPNGYFSVNTEGRVGRCNRYLVEMLGYKSADEIVGMPIKDLYADTPQGKSKVQQIFQDVRAGGTVHDEELQMQKRDGTPLWTSLTTNAERDDEGQFRWTRSMVVNITERKRMEILLKIERDLGLVLSATSGLNETLSLCFDAAIRVSGMECGGIYLVDETSGDLDLVIHKGCSADFVKSVSHYNRDSVNARLVMAGKPIYTQYEELGVPLSENKRSEGLRSIAIIPVKSENRIIACFNISSHTLDEVPDFARTALETIATHIGNAISRARTEETVRESEENYRELADSIGDVFFAMDKDLKYTYWNKASENLLGVPAKDAIGKSLYEVFPQIRGTRAEEVYLEVLRTQQAQSFINEFRIGNKNFVFDINAYPSHRGLSVFTKDITEQKRMEEALQKSEELFSKIFYTSPVPISLTTLSEGRFLNVNDSFLHLLGYRREEVIGQTAIELNLWANPEDRKRLLERLREHGTVRGLDAKLRSKSGEIRETLASIELIEMAGEHTLLGLTQDITEQKRAEEALRESQANLSALIENTNDWICSVDSGYRILTMNNAFKKRFHYFFKIEVQEGMNIMEYILPEWRALWADVHVRALKGEHFSFENHYEQQGYSVDLEIAANPITEENGEVTGVSYFFRDITERKQAEEALRTSEAQLSNAMEIARLGYWEYDVASDLFTFDDHFYSIFRTTAEREGGYKMSPARYAERFVHPDDMSVVGLETQKAIETTDPHYSRQLEHRIIYADGETGYIAVRFFIIKDNQGRTIKTYGANQDITERKQAEKALRESEETARQLSQENAIMAEIGQIISSTLNIEDVYENFAEKVRKLIPFDRITIHIFNPVEYTIHPAYITGVKVIYPTREPSIPLAGTLAEEVIRTRTTQLIQIEDLQKVKEMFPGLLPNFQAGIRLVMATPLISKDGVIGVLHLQSTQLNAYGKKDLRLAEKVANQIAGAIANAQLFVERKQAEKALRESEETNRQLSQENAIMAEIGRIVSSTLNLDDVYDRFAEKVRELIPFDRITIHILNSEENTLRPAYVTGISVAYPLGKAIVSLAGTSAEKAIRYRTTRLLQIENLKKVMDMDPGLLPIFEAGIRLLMAIPLVSKDEVMGVLHIQSCKPDAYSEKDMRVAERIGLQIGGAIANAQLFAERKQAEEQLKNSREQ